MQVEEIKKLIAASEEMRTKLYISHKRLALNRTPENLEIFKKTVDNYKKMLSETGAYNCIYASNKAS